MSAKTEYRIQDTKDRDTFFSGWFGKHALWGNDKVYKPYLEFFDAEMDVARLVELGYRVSIRSVVSSSVTAG